MTRLELDDIQGILRGYSATRFPRARYLFVRFGSGENARDWLADTADEVTSAERQPDAVRSVLNIAVTWTGLDVLGVGEATLYSFPEEFRLGMVNRAQKLGDIDVNDPAHWEDGGPGPTRTHAVVIVHAGTWDDLERRCQQVSGALAGRGEIVCSQNGHRLLDEAGHQAASGNHKPRSREHFGFVDGLSQPVIEGLGNTAAESLPGQGAHDADGRWRPLRAGEIILGYPDEENVLPACPSPPSLGHNGSYLVYRKLEQDVAAFRRLMADQAEHYHGGPEELAAKMVGRRRDGMPLVWSDEHEPTTSGRPMGAFTYADDLDGHRCPVGSHIRRVNPRDGFRSNDRIVHRHRMLRRGIPYGPPLPGGVLDHDGESRGLLFVCLCASIARQFEFVQGEWCNDGNNLGLGQDQDPFLNNASRGTNFTIPGARAWFVHPVPPLVTVRGGEYFFLPGRRALARLANRSFSASPDHQTGPA